MKVALTVWENRVSPLFDSASVLLIADIEGRVITKKHLEPFACESPFSRAARLDDLGVNVLICGGISDFYANLVEARRIKIIPFAAGAVYEVLKAYMTGNVYGKNYRMPGCEILEDNAFQEEG
jgi:predicted Fe-Mo cluster-binding NifX family protein